MSRLGGALHARCGWFRFSLLEGPLTVVGFKLVELGLEVLPDGRNASVSAFHCLAGVKG